MATRTAIESVKMANEEKFINRPGITGMATGYKIVGGKKTDGKFWGQGNFGVRLKYLRLEGKRDQVFTFHKMRLRYPNNM